MSLAADTRSHTRVVRTQKEKALLTLSDNLIKQVHYMHTVVERNIEWSGILVYEVLEGDINTPKDLKLFVHELIPMDVGTSGYTEYEYDAEDDYSFERIADALEKGYKLGQIHTHHSMGTFFSGTDMSELHDNVVKHNFYLSLIVDYKNHGDWVAKIAVDGKEVMSGTVSTTGFKKKTGIITKVISWIGQINTEDVSDTDHEEYEDYVSTEVVETVTPVLFVIDTNIVLEEKASEWETRVEELNEKRSAASMHRANNYRLDSRGTRPQYSWTPKDSNIERYDSGGPNDARITDVQGNPFNYYLEDEYEEEDLDLFGETVGSKSKHIMSLDTKNKPFRKTSVFNEDTCLPLLIMLIKTDSTLPEGDTLDTELELLMDKNPSVWVNEVEDIIEDWCIAYFNVGELDSLDMHCIASCMKYILFWQYVNGEQPRGGGGSALVESVLDSYILQENLITPREVERLTGIKN